MSHVLCCVYRCYIYIYTFTHIRINYNIYIYENIYIYMKIYIYIYIYTYTKLNTDPATAYPGLPIAPATLGGAQVVRDGGEPCWLCRMGAATIVLISVHQVQ